MIAAQSRRVTKPVSETRLDFGNPILRGILRVYNLREGTVFDAVTGELATAVNGPSNAQMRGVKYVRSSSQYTLCGTNHLLSKYHPYWTIFAVASHDSLIISNSGDRAIYGERAPTGSDIIKLDLSCATSYNGRPQCVIRNDSGTLIQLKHTTPVTYGKEHCLYAGISNTTPFAGMDGLITTGTYSASGFTNANIQRRIAGDAADSGGLFDGTISLVALWGRALQSFELVELSKNPWQLFVSTNHRRLYFFPTGAIRYGRPISDESVQWTPSTGSVNYALLADEDSGTYIQATGAAVDVYRCTAMDTSGATNPQISFEVPSGFTPSGTVTVQLWQGNPSSGTKIAERAVTDPTAGTTYTADVTGTISDGSDLWWRVVSS